MKMRVMVFENKMMIRRLTVSLAREGIEVLTGDPEAIKQERFDVAVVDGLMKET